MESMFLYEMGEHCSPLRLSVVYYNYFTTKPANLLHILMKSGGKMPVIAILSNKDIIFYNARVYSCSDSDFEIFCDILLVMPDFDAEKFKISTKIAIIYGDLGFDSFQNIKYEEIITYGMSSKSTATISSLTSSDMLIAVQREITDFSGKIIEIGERLYQNTRENSLETLAISLLFMISGN